MDLQGMDWTRYAGFLHTDHSIRTEFFVPDAAPSDEVTKREYIQDFTYLYDHAAKDHVKFVKGQNVSEEEVVQELGRPEDWPQVTGKPGKGIAHPAAFTGKLSPAQQKAHPEVAALLKKCRHWALKPSELEHWLA